MKRLVLAASFAACVLIGNSSEAADPDPWFAHDKFLHASISGVLADLTYSGGTQLFDSRGCALLAAAGVTLVVGAGKETYDLTGRGDPSWKDFTWDVIGTAAGLAFAWSMDLFVRGASPKRPLFLAPAPSGVAVRF